VLRPLSTSDSGFSLAEALVALAILAGALLSLARTFTAAASVVTTARHITNGSILGAQKLEELRAVAAGLPPGPRISSGIELIDRTGIAVPEVTASAQVTYTRQWWIEPLPSDPEQVSVIRVIVTPGVARRRGLESEPRRADEVLVATMHARDAP
jgi:hypothetical protein